jgi:hypothetical protein
MYYYPKRAFIIKRLKLNGICWHFGLQLPDGRVTDFTGESKVRVVSLEKFAEGREVLAVRELSPVQMQGLHDNLHLAMTYPARYHVLNWNCESYVYWLAVEEPRSEQVSSAVVLGLVGLGLYAAAKA